MKKINKLQTAGGRINKEGIFRFNWRMTWYSVLIWLLAIVVGGFVILPWFYLVLPFVVFWLTIIYFRKEEKSLKMGLLISLFWFSTILILDILELAGPYYANLGLYFSDSRNWLKYSLILLLPVIYCLILENRKVKKVHRGRPAKLGRPTVTVN